MARASAQWLVRSADDQQLHFMQSLWIDHANGPPGAVWAWKGFCAQCSFVCCLCAAGWHPITRPSRCFSQSPGKKGVHRRYIFSEGLSCVQPYGRMSRAM
eukprot:1937795-Heterocapsa_arctica.AAC.1